MLSFQFANFCWIPQVLFACKSVLSAQILIILFLRLIIRFQLTNCYLTPLELSVTHSVHFFQIHTILESPQEFYTFSKACFVHLPVFGFDSQDLFTPHIQFYFKLASLCLKAQVSLIFLQFRPFPFANVCSSHQVSYMSELVHCVQIIIVDF